MIGQFRVTVTPCAVTTAWKSSLFPLGSTLSTFDSPPIA
jgi:hypothetical protein